MVGSAKDLTRAAISILSERSEWGDAERTVVDLSYLAASAVTHRAVNEISMSRAGREKRTASFLSSGSLRAR
jgi:hypothetical protein